MFLCSMHRSVFSALAPVLAVRYHLSSSDIGLLQAVALAAYLFGLIPSGRLADTLGGAEVLLGGLLLWSLGTTVTAAAAATTSHALPVLVLSRVLVGLFSSCIMPAVSAMSAAELPASRRASLVSLIYAVFNVGGVAGLVAAPIVGAKAGWAAAFLWSAAVGVAWAGFAWWMLRDRWSGRNKVLAASPSPQQGRRAGQPSAWYRRQGTLAQVAALCWSHAVIGAGFFVLQSWIPMYLTSRGGIAPGALGAMSGAPWLAAALSSVLAGAVSDRLLAHGWEVLDVRRLMHGVSTLGCTLSLLPLALLPSLPMHASAACLAAALACYGCCFSGFHAYVQDVTTQGAGTMLGITNSCGVVMGILGNLATGWAVDATGSYCLVFGALAALYATSWALFASTMKGEPIRLSMA